jgi:excinuclease ABC subunit C
MGMIDEPLRSRLKHLPAAPGVYLMKDEAGAILYVGKAKSLRSRVRSYFAGSHPESLKTRELVRRIADVETIVVANEAEALILENNLIKEHAPRFNINLRDDKTYPYIKVTVREPFPRVLVTRRLVRDGSRYFGPYTDVRRMRSALDLVKRLYTVRSCHYDLPREAPARPCLDHHIGRCHAPCVGLQDESAYAAMIQEILDVLEGRTRRVGRRIRSAMETAAAELNFERAAELRDALARLEALEARQHVVDVAGADRDIVGFARDGDDAMVVVLRVREGKLLGREALSLDNLAGEGDAAVLAASTTRFYAGGAAEGAGLPPEVIVPLDFDDRHLLESVLSVRAGRAVRLHVPQRGDKVRLVELAEQNARHLLEERKLLGAGGGDRAPDALYELQEALALQMVPRLLVCFDVSHTQGTETVASVVAFENGAPDKSQYRRMKIRGDWGNDDYRSMQEAVGRYLRRRADEEGSLPDLLVIDGGKGQLSAAMKALEELGMAHLPVIGLAKKEELIFVPGRSEGLRLPRRSVALRLLQRARDEAHRFAVTYNRKLRTRRTVRSELSEIRGIGAARQRTLLERFGSLRGVAAAAEAEIAALPGFGPRLAAEVLRQVRSPTGAAGAAGAAAAGE